MTTAFKKSFHILVRRFSTIVEESNSTFHSLLGKRRVLILFFRAIILAREYAIDIHIHLHPRLSVVQSSNGTSSERHSGK